MTLTQMTFIASLGPRYVASALNTGMWSCLPKELDSLLLLDCWVHFGLLALAGPYDHAQLLKEYMTNLATHVS